MLECVEVRLDVGYDKRLMYEYCIEPLKCDRDIIIITIKLTHYLSSLLMMCMTLQ